jgi:deoxyribose-phosphate aldolase
MNARELEFLVQTVVEEVLRQVGSEDHLPAAAGSFLLPPAPIGNPVAGIGSGITGELPRNVAALIDHTLLKPDASRFDIDKLCKEAVHAAFASVCVNPWYVPLAAARTQGSAVSVCAVVGFPLGATLTPVKMLEAEEAIKLGAKEIDVVQNVGALKSGDEDIVEADIRAVADVAHRAGAICKVILETAVLTTEEKVRAALAAKLAGADYIKTSTGFGPAGATAEDVALIRTAIGPRIGIKAAGGIRTLDDLHRMLAAGATRIGASASMSILAEASRLET